MGFMGLEFTSSTGARSVFTPTLLSILAQVSPRNSPSASAAVTAMAPGSSDAPSFMRLVEPPSWSVEMIGASPVFS